MSRYIAIGLPVRGERVGLPSMHGAIPHAEEQGYKEEESERGQGYHPH